VTHVFILAAALLIEAAFGFPQALFRTIRHPVVWFGAVISLCDRSLNRPTLSFATRKALGVAGLAVLLSVVVGTSAFLQTLLLHTLPFALAIAVLGLLTSSLLAQRSLWSHVHDVATGLEHRGLEGGRDMVSRIVGRNPQSLDEAGVIRAAIESLAENFADGVVAPALWCAIAGLPGIAFYKSVNTADSMIGHRSERHEAYGWAAARLDDLINLPASRLAAFWIVLAATILPNATPGAALRAMFRDARTHRSPNAGWPEAAMAGALGLRLAGPRVYGHTTIEDGWMGRGRAEATIPDLHRALSLYRLACGLQIAAVLALVIAQV